MQANKMIALRGFIMVMSSFFWCLSLSSALAEDSLDEKPPPTLEAYNTKVLLNGCASREILWIDLYMVSLYLPKPTTEQSIAISADSPKVFRIKVTYDGSLPKGIPSGEWKEILKADLSQKIFDRLNIFMGSLNQGDVIQVSAAPGHGDQLWLNGKLVIEESKADLSEALSKLWLGPKPVSKNIRRLLLLGHCK